MKGNKILLKVNKASLSLIIITVLSSCLLFQRPLLITVLTVFATSVISVPALISLQMVIWLQQWINFERTIIWMLLFPIIPLVSLIAAGLLVDFVPGKIGLIILLGMFSSYLGITKYAASVSKLFELI